MANYYIGLCHSSSLESIGFTKKLVVMNGPWIGGDTFADVKKVNDRDVYMIYQDPYTKMVSKNGEEKYYNGKISDFDPSKWNTYSNTGGGKYLFNDDFTLKQCFKFAEQFRKNGESYSSLAFLPNYNSRQDNTLNAIGKCYLGNVQNNPNTGSMGSNYYKIYILGDCLNNSDSGIDESCMKTTAIRTLNNFIDNNDNVLKFTESRKISIKDNIDYITAYNKLSQEKNKEKIAEYEELLNNIRLSHKSSKQLLSDKNRLIASTSSNIQTSTDKLEDLNNKINEANQEIAKNNSDFEKKNNIITTLRAMITIFFILLLVMIVYYGALYTRDTYPETYNSITNSINNSFSGFSSFNTNY